jgi:hypothetical protein
LLSIPRCHPARVCANSCLTVCLSRGIGIIRHPLRRIWLEAGFDIPG